MLQCEKQTPQVLAGGRLDSLSYIRDQFLSTSKGEVVYVCGPPGTGKTAGVLKICEKVQQEYMNVMTYKTAKQWLRGLFERMKQRNQITKQDEKSTSTELILKSLKRAFNSKIVVVIDEVDNFNKKELTNFTRILQTLAHFKELRIIAIANTVNLLQESITDVKFHQILCAQYTHQESMDILESRIKQGLSKQDLELDDLFQRDALRKLAMVMQRGEPDVRKLLEIIIEVSKLAQARCDQLELKCKEFEIEGTDSTPNYNELRVRMQDMNDVLNQRYGSVVERVMSKIPKNTKIYAGLVARMASHEKATLLKQEETLVELNRFMRAYKLERIGLGGLNDIITSLQFEGVLERVSKKVKGKSQQMVKLKMNIAEMIEASEDIFELWAL